MDEFNLERFKQAQDPIYHRVIAELNQGKKQSHWMWFVFPQIDGLGASLTARRYAIKSLDEARAYLADPLLAGRLQECASLLLEIEGRSASQIMGYPDDLKLKSSMTLFSIISEENSVFQQVLEHYYNGEQDRLTLSRV